MGILDLFKKKEEHSGSPNLIDAQLHQEGMAQTPEFGASGPQMPPMPAAPDFGAQSPASFGERQQFQQVQQSMSQEQQFQILSAKLDTIKAQLETIMQRLDRIERDEHPYKERWRGM
jgi:hypothetical protein